MKFATWICGIFAFVMLVLFLGKYAVSINSIPLWIIIIGCLIPPIADVVLTARQNDASQESDQETAEH